MSSDFTRAMRRLIGHCTAISVGEGEDRSGLVVTSGVSLSADPAQVLFCVNKGASAWPLFRRYGCFGWSSLGAGHQELAQRFAGFGGVKGADRYDGADWVTAETGAPLLKDAVIAFDCALAEMIDRETHSIVVGEVKAIRMADEASALAYWNGAFRPMTA
ncbi:MAG: flavin reductase family protein [Rhodobacter sp.]|nr:flavin reductase family protein [Paracoccaceae bacterium]MCC0080752.1 flavin reductase family protein [Rhodobacter sp.]